MEEVTRGSRMDTAGLHVRHGQKLRVGLRLVGQSGWEWYGRTNKDAQWAMAGFKRGEKKVHWEL
ncbi:hypothetical protein Csa_021367 [Cucumis sativus]|uniref:Uncharacterized protein n=1 Tax=Cucumis sativus TaxID=3659 RepID=A0A0A0LGQ6_CUCSA|nr:hypothetical protein Csa_021367 [Cucumis sativus]